MMKASKRREARQQALDHNLIDEQAEESDEDMGWGLAGGDEDEEEGNDEGYIQDLVDDQAIDEEQRRLQDELAAAKARCVHCYRRKCVMLMIVTGRLQRRTMRNVKPKRRR